MDLEKDEVDFEPQEPQKELSQQSNPDEHCIIYQEKGIMKNQSNHFWTHTNLGHVQNTSERYLTLQNTKSDSKNIPQRFGYHFCKFMESTIKKNGKQFELHSLPDQLQKFINIKSDRKNRKKHDLDNFRDLFNDPICKSGFNFTSSIIFTSIYFLVIMFPIPIFILHILTTTCGEVNRLKTKTLQEKLKDSKQVSRISNIE